MVGGKLKYLLLSICVLNILAVPSNAVEVRQGLHYITSMDDLNSIGIKDEDLKRCNLTLQELIDMGAFLEEFKVGDGQEGQYNKYVLEHYREIKQKQTSTEPYFVYDYNGNRKLIEPNSSVENEDSSSNINKYGTYICGRDFIPKNPVNVVSFRDDGYEEYLKKEEEAKKIQVKVKVYDADSGEYLGETVAKTEGTIRFKGLNGSLENLGIRYTIPYKFNGLYSSAYIQHVVQYKYHTISEIEYEGEGSLQGAQYLDQDDIKNGVIYVKAYYFKEVQQGWINKGQGWSFLVYGELKKGWYLYGSGFEKNDFAVDATFINMEYEWRKYFYFDQDGIMQTGWKLIDGKWYYFYSNGIMASNTTIDGYHLGSDGAWDY